MSTAASPTSRIVSVVTSRPRVTAAVLEIPRSSTHVRASSTTAANARHHGLPSPRAYLAAVVAIAAQEATLPTTKHQPAANPQRSPRRSRPYT